MVGTRVADGTIWTRWMREAMRSLGRCLRGHKLKGKAKAAVPELYSLVLVQPTGSELGSQQQCSQQSVCEFPGIVPKARPCAVAQTRAAPT